MKGTINFEMPPLVPSDFRGTGYLRSADTAVTRVMLEDLVNGMIWYGHK